MTREALTEEMPLEPENMYPDRPMPRAEVYTGVLGKAAHAFREYSEADPIGILFSMLALASGAIGGGPHIFAMEDHPLITQVCLIGDKGFGLKGTATNHARDLFRRALPTFAGKHVGTWTPVSGPDFVFRVADMAIGAEWFKGDVKLEELVLAEENPLKWIRSRFPMTLIVQEWVNIISAARMDPNLDSHMRTSWQGDDLQAKLKKGWLDLVAPHIAIIGNTTPTEFLGTIGVRSIDGGSLTRLLIAFVHQTQTIRVTKRIPANMLDRFAEGIKAGVTYAQKVGEVTWTPEAEKLWATPKTGIHDRLMSRVLSDPLLKEFFSNRPRVHAPRLAATYALMGKRSKITPADIKAAWAILDYAMDSVLFMFNTHGARFAKRFAPEMLNGNGKAKAPPTINGDASKAHANVTERIKDLLISAGPTGMLVSAIQPQVRHLNKYTEHGPANKEDVNNSLEALKPNITIEWATRKGGGSGRTGIVVTWIGPTDDAPAPVPLPAPESAPKRLPPVNPTQPPTPAPIVRQRASGRPSRKVPPARRPARSASGLRRA
jgi:hypothetical protein